MRDYFVYVRWKTVGVSDKYFTFKSLREAKCWILKWYKKIEEVKLIEGRPLFVQYENDISNVFCRGRVSTLDVSRGKLKLCQQLQNI